MELKNIFKMTKTDRYTQDGRDELAKLQETEDVKYKTGDISQKTGLQKQPDGSWAPPKGGAAPKMGSPEYNEKYGLTKRDVATGKEIDRIYEKHQNRIKELKAKGYTDEQIENDKIYQQTKEDMRNVGKSKPGRDYPVLKNKDHVDLAKEVKSNTMPGSDWTAEEIAKEWKLGKADAEEVKKEFDKIKTENKPAENKPTDKYKDLPGAQKKDALYASTFEGSSIGMTQTSMERNGWDLVQADDDVNVYGKPDGSKVTMKHDGQRITSTEYEAPENKPAGNANKKEYPLDVKINEFVELYKGMDRADALYDIEVKRAKRAKELRKEKPEIPAYMREDPEFDALGMIQQQLFADKPLTNLQSRDSAPRILTGDTKIRIRK